jgi:Uma2 family endonuclease
MGMPQHATRWTAEMVRALPDDGNRYEVVDGELLVTPAPTRPHQRAVTILAVLLAEYARKAGIGEALTSPADIELDPHGMVQPDVFVEGLIDGRLARAWNVGAPLLLAVEVLSPSTARADRTVKRRRFQRAAVPEYWIVDLDARVVERWRPDDQRPEVLGEDLVWHPAGAREPLTIALPPLFARIHGERL